MASVETFWEVEARVVYDCWVRLPIGEDDSLRFSRESEARAALDEFRRTGREARLVKVTREIIGI